MGRYSNEFRERGVRLAQEAMDKHDSRWAAVESIAKKLGCSPQTLDKWLKQAERDTGKRAGLTSAAAFSGSWNTDLNSASCGVFVTDTADDTTART